MTQDRWGVAWDTIAGRAIRIESGDAERLRPLCKSRQLQCPVEGCASPDLNTVRGYFKGRTWVRDYFRHVRMDDESLHSGESAQHWLAKMHMQVWAESLGLVAVVERYQSDVRRRPDVSIEDPASGERLHIEIQFSPITDEMWRARDRDLRQTGATVLWLWGTGMGNTRAALTSAQRECVRRYGTAWFVAANGEEVFLAAGHSRLEHDARRWSTPLVDDGRAQFTWRGTGELRLDTSGPIDDNLARVLAVDAVDARAFLLNELRKRIQRRRNRLRAIERGRNAAASRPSRNRRTPVWASELVRHSGGDSNRPQPVASPFDKLRTVDDQYSKLVEHVHWTDKYVYRPPKVWKQVLVNEHFRPGNRFTLADAESTVRDFANMREPVRAAVREFLEHAVRVRQLKSVAPGFYMV